MHKHIQARFIYTYIYFVIFHAFFHLPNVFNSPIAADVQPGLLFTCLLFLCTEVNLEPWFSVYNMY